MSIRRFFVEDLVVVRAVEVVDRYGNAAKDWAAATRTAVKGWVAPTGSSELGDQREAQTTTRVAFLDPAVDVAALDRVEYRGTTYEVAGDPAVARAPRGAHHLEVNLVVVKG